MFQSVDNYCERLDPSFWSEPVNAASNISFIIAAFIVIRLLPGNRDGGTRLLISILMLIGLGSFLFHTFAQQWAGIADVLPILLFILSYIYLATRRYLGQSILISAIAVAGFFPFAIGTAWALGKTLGPLNGSNIYVSVAILIAFYGVILLKRQRRTAIGLLIGAAILCISIAFRSIDQAVCISLPLGTHFLWHILNGIMLGWMILVLARHQKD